MSFALLASATRGLFIAMLIIMIVVSFLFALIVFIALRPVKKPPEEVDPNNVKSMLTRRESNLLMELMQLKDDEPKRAELINKLRRVKSAQALVDELIEEEKAINQASEEDEENRSKRKAEEAAKAKEASAKKAAEKNGGDKNADKPKTPVEKPAAKRQPPKNAKSKKNSLEFKPSSEVAGEPAPESSEGEENK